LQLAKPQRILDLTHNGCADFGSQWLVALLIRHQVLDRYSALSTTGGRHFSVLTTGGHRLQAPNRIRIREAGPL